jgi:hypothetical protein
MPWSYRAEGMQCKSESFAQSLKDCAWRRQRLSGLLRLKILRQESPVAANREQTLKAWDFLPRKARTIDALQDAARVPIPSPATT